MVTISPYYAPHLDLFQESSCEKGRTRFRRYLHDCPEVKWLTMTDGILKIMLVVGAILVWFIRWMAFGHTGGIKWTLIGGFTGLGIGLLISIFVVNKDYEGWKKKHRIELAAEVLGEKDLLLSKSDDWLQEGLSRKKLLESFQASFSTISKYNRFFTSVCQDLVEEMRYCRNAYIKELVWSLSTNLIGRNAYDKKVQQLDQLGEYV